MKTLKTVQTLSKIGRVLSKIVFIFCIVGFCGCLVGVAGLLAGAEALKLGGMTLHGLLEAEAEMSLPDTYAAIAIGLVFCAAEAVLSKFAEVYFKRELADGTPFTLRGAKELLRLGILTIAIPTGALIVCAIGMGVARQLVPELRELSVDGFGSVGLGLGMIVASLLCRLGAETAKNEE